MDVPPPYLAASPLPEQRSALLRLPIHLQLQILSHASLPTLVFGVKPVCRALRLAAGAIARNRDSVRLKWGDGIRRVATSTTGRAASCTGVNLDREPSRLEGSHSNIPAGTREERVYDLFVASLATLERDRHESVLLLDGGENVDEGAAGTFERDLFGFWQPIARCEDLVIDRGKAEGWIQASSQDPSRSTPAFSDQAREEDVKIELRTRSAKLLLPISRPGSTPMWKSVVEVSRTVDDDLERTAMLICRAAREVR
ncbi:uncharacterized protein JCM15063_005078 [Sporobolomyces koalae]|uniref:uncharacterized protein n=1 Tax=Sporobolomyces koalae TaxID=500713 RepID=UPI00316F77AF